MDNTASSGEVDSDDPANHSDHELDDWSASHKETAAASRFLYLTVEYVGEPPSDFGRITFPSFEPGAPFSPQTSSSLSEFERVSPLHSDMNSPTPYSPVYAISNSPSANTNPDSPFRNQVVVLTNSSTTSSQNFSDNSQTAVVASADIVNDFVDQILPSSDNSEGLLSQVVAGPNFFPQSSPSPDNFVVTTETVSSTSDLVSPTNELLMHSSSIESTGELVVSADGNPFVMSATEGLKGDVQLLISNGDVSGITYSLDGQTSFLSSSRILDVGSELLASQADDANLGSVLRSLKNEGEGLISNNVKVSIMDANQLNTSQNYGDILMDTTTIENGVVSDETSSVEKDVIGLHRSERVSPISLQGTEMKSFNKEIWCEECNLSYEGGCSKHLVQSISDKPVPSRAWATLPASYLSINKVSVENDGTAVYGVFARKTIPQRTQFGPIQGILAKSDTVQIENKNGLKLLVETETGAMMSLDVSSEIMSNWMRFVRAAKSVKEQNLSLSQQGHSLYFTTTRMIHPRQELQVWYSSQYAAKRNLPLLQPDAQIKSEAQSSWPCFECNEKFSNSKDLQKHLNIHDNERGEDLVGGKMKMRKSNRNNRRKNLLRYGSRKFKTCVDKSKQKELPYQCNICKRSFPRNYSLKRHLLLHSSNKKYSCEICGHQFSHLYNRDRHLGKHYKNQANGNTSFSAGIKKKCNGVFRGKNGMTTKKEWLCSHCNLNFDNPSVLNLHTLAHAAANLSEPEPEFITGLPSDLTNTFNKKEFKNGSITQCPQCTQEFESKKELIEHVSEHGKSSDQIQQLRKLRGTVNPAKPWKCELCYKSFASEDRLQRHMLVHGAEESKPLQCEVCYKRFLNNSALACHVKIHTAEKKMFECPICKNVFEQVLSLKEHVHIHSENGLYTCPQCNKVFDGYSLIRKHIRAFHSDRKHTCSYCNKLFPTLDKLRMHMLRHSDHREFLCANCGKQFKRKDKLKEHMKRMHSAERELRLAMKPHRPPSSRKLVQKVQVSPTDYNRFIYKCHTCLVGFKRRGMLVNHLANRHPDISPDSVPELNLPILKTTRDYYCQYCEKVYKSSSKRKAHILKIHPGAELPMSNRRKGGVPDIPGVPNPTFSQTVGSITTHPHGCQWCHKQYASKAKLLQHQRKKHMDLLPQSQQIPRSVKAVSSPEISDDCKFSPGNDSSSQPVSDVLPSQTISIIPGDYQLTADEELQEFQESSIIIDATTLKRPLKSLQLSPDILSQTVVTELNHLGELRLSVTSTSNDHFLRIVEASPSPTSSGQLGQLLTETYSLPSSPRTWADAHITYTPYTAR